MVVRLHCITLFCNVTQCIFHRTRWIALRSPASLLCSAVLRLEEEIELFEADLEAMGCGEGRAKVRSHLRGAYIPPQVSEALMPCGWRAQYTCPTEQSAVCLRATTQSSMVVPLY